MTGRDALWDTGEVPTNKARPITGRRPLPIPRFAEPEAETEAAAGATGTGTASAWASATRAIDLHSNRCYTR